VYYDKGTRADLPPPTRLVEHNPKSWRRTLEVVRGALQKDGIQLVTTTAAVGIATSAKLALVWDKTTGKPLNAVIV